MRLNSRQKGLLRGIWHDRHRLAAVNISALDGLSRGRYGLLKRRTRMAREHGLVPMNLAGWIGHPPTNSERVIYHRQCVRLEAMGLIERHNLHGGRRTTHIRLTPAGERLARELVLDEALEPAEGFDLDAMEIEPLYLPEEEGTR